MAGTSIVSGSSTQISRRSKPIALARSMRSSVRFENGETQMNVLAPNSIALVPFARGSEIPLMPARDQEKSFAAPEAGAAGLLRAKRCRRRAPSSMGPLMMSHAFLLGGTDQIGSATAAHLIDAGWTVTAFRIPATLGMAGWSRGGERPKGGSRHRGKRDGEGRKLGESWEKALRRATAADVWDGLAN